ncbi:MAG: hypothetical protein HJJLKODD_01171 [Phycisphaerae bacterium]|nr:hypothetical protein [Phycisphaerae bacterium]
MVGRFDEAERLAAQQNKELVILYKSWLDEASGRMQRDLQYNSSLQPLLTNRIVCILEQGYEPNQRFVAQFDIASFPTLIVRHTDGTFHAQSGSLSNEQMVAFLSSAQPPGRPIRVNAQIPRNVDYQWQVQYDVALPLARQQNRLMFIFYKAVFNPQSNEVLWNVLNRPEVAEEFEAMVNCRLDWGYAPNRQTMTRFGISDVPGFVILHPDGRFLARQGLVTAEQLISFAKQAKAQLLSTPANP